MKQPGLSREKVLAAVVRLLETSLIRVGNDDYAQQNQSFGLTTMRDRHVTVKGGTARFAFHGKSGILHAVAIEDRRLARSWNSARTCLARSCFNTPTTRGRFTT